MKKSIPSIQLDNHRRNTLKRLVAGGALLTAGAALPSTWVRPVVSSVVLPAHAQTSEEEEQDSSGRFSLAHIDTHLRKNWLDWIIPRAHAVEACEMFTGCSSLDNNGNVTMFMQLSDGSISACFSGSGKIGDTVTFSVSDGGLGLTCGVRDVDLVDLTGDKPNRTLVIRFEGNESVEECVETSGPCDCDSFAL